MLEDVTLQVTLQSRIGECLVYWSIVGLFSSGIRPCGVTILSTMVWCVGILGRNGRGKSTLLQALALAQVGQVLAPQKKTRGRCPCLNSVGILLYVSTRLWTEPFHPLASSAATLLNHREHFRFQTVGICRKLLVAHFVVTVHSLRPTSALMFDALVSI